MKTNRMIILINKLVETKEEIDTGGISAQSLFRSYQESQNYSLSRDDIFIGADAHYNTVIDRLEEFALLSHLRPGCLEVMYYSSFAKIEALFNSDYEDHLQFYDQSASYTNLMKVLDKFHNQFELKFVRPHSTHSFFPKRNDTENKSHGISSTSQAQLRLA